MDKANAGSEPMKLEIRFHEGWKGKPLVIFIHGMGMNLNSWVDPSGARILGGKYPLKVLLGETHGRTQTCFADLRELGFSVLAWSQARPAGPINAAVNELKGLLKEFHVAGRNGIILVGHSRGGLVARKALEELTEGVRGVVTLAAPHRGTSLARWAVFVSPAAFILNRLYQGFGRGDVNSAICKILGFLSSSGLREMLPGSAFFSTLRDGRLKGAGYISAGGTNPDLLKAINISMSEIVSKLVPPAMIPEEMRDGHGDGIVTSSSSVLPYGDEHRNFHVNHAAILFDKAVREFVVRKIESF